MEGRKEFASRPGVIGQLSLLDDMKTLTHTEIAELLRDQALTNQMWEPLRKLYKEAADRLKLLTELEAGQERLRQAVIGRQPETEGRDTFPDGYTSGLSAALNLIAPREAYTREEQWMDGQ